MVGTTRFELATSPTPRVRSTRLSHVPTMVCTSAQTGDGGVIALLSVHDRPALRPTLLVAWSNILLRQRSTFTKEKLVHLLHQKLLRLSRPRLQTILVQQHLLPFHPLAPRLLRNILINLLPKVRIERRFVQPFHLSLESRVENHVCHSWKLLLKLPFYDAPNDCAASNYHYDHCLRHSDRNRHGTHGRQRVRCG